MTYLILKYLALAIVILIGGGWLISRWLTLNGNQDQPQPGDSDDYFGKCLGCNRLRQVTKHFGSNYCHDCAKTLDPKVMQSWDAM